MDGVTFSDREFKFAEADGRMTVAGYGSVFNVVDRGGDVVLPGAFAESLIERQKSGAGALPMYLEHGRYGGGPVVPVGKWTEVSEDSIGLKVAGELVDTPAGREAHTLLKAGLLGGLSIGYRVKDFERGSGKAGEPRRVLKGLGLFEVSLVQDAMNQSARVLAVKSAAEICTIREYEDFLRDVGGFSAAQSKALASGGWKAFEAKRDAGEGLDELAEMIRRNATILA